MSRITTTTRTPARTSNETILRRKAREAIRAGKLPNRAPDRSWGGQGVGADCPICSAVVSEQELELEIEFDREGDRPPHNYHIHVHCFTAWERERVELARRGRSPLDQDRAATLPAG